MHLKRELYFRLTNRLPLVYLLYSTDMTHAGKPKIRSSHTDTFVDKLQALQLRLWGQGLASSAMRSCTLMLCFQGFTYVFSWWGLNASKKRDYETVDFTAYVILFLSTLLCFSTIFVADD